MDRPDWGNRKTPPFTVIRAGISRTCNRAPDSRYDRTCQPKPTRATNKANTETQGVQEGTRLPDMLPTCYKVGLRPEPLSLRPENGGPLLERAT